MSLESPVYVVSIAHLQVVLWGGVKVSPKLRFELEELISFRRESPGRISIFGVREKI